MKGYTYFLVNDTTKTVFPVGIIFTNKDHFIEAKQQYDDLIRHYNVVDKKAELHPVEIDYDESDKLDLQRKFDRIHNTFRENLMLEAIAELPSPEPQAGLVVNTKRGFRFWKR